MVSRRAHPLRGAARLAVDATGGVVDLVEAMHARIARVPGLGAAEPTGRTRGLTGLVYKSVRGTTRLVGGGIDALLAALTPWLGEDHHPGPEREAIVAALNGVLGDHLDATANPLATAMTLRHQGRALELDALALGRALPDAQADVLLLVHGLCMNDLQWRRDGHDHGQVLAAELALTPLYLRYNSGLPIARNGRELAWLLEQLVRAWPVPLRRLVIVAHSMGGLVVRSAWHHATTSARPRPQWPRKLQDMVFLGTPHHGAPLERAGHGVDLLLAATPYTAPFTRLAGLRSAGITDLRHGRVIEDEAPAASAAPVRHVALPEGVRCHAIAATLAARAGRLKDGLVGDGLVPLASALGRHADAARTLAFDPERVWIARGMNHMELLSRPDVAATMLGWLSGDPGRSGRSGVTGPGRHAPAMPVVAHAPDAPAPAAPPDRPPQDP